MRRRVPHRGGFEERLLETAGGFDDDACGLQGQELCDDGFEAIGVVGHMEEFAGVGACDVEGDLGDVDADEDIHAGVWA